MLNFNASQPPTGPAHVLFEGDRDNMAKLRDLFDAALIHGAAHATTSTDGKVSMTIQATVTE